VEEHLTGWWVGRCTHFLSGRQTVGRPRERSRSIGRGLFTPFLGGQTSVSSVWTEADQTSDGEKKHLKPLFLPWKEACWDSLFVRGISANCCIRKHPPCRRYQHLWYDCPISPHRFYNSHSLRDKTISYFVSYDATESGHLPYDAIP